MKLRSKLLLGLSTLPILLIILIVMGYIQLSTFNSKNESIQNSYESTLLVEQVHKDMKNEGIQLRNLILSDDEDKKKSALSKLQEEGDSITENIALLESRVQTKEQKKLIANLKDANQEYNTYKNNLITLNSNGKKDEAILLLNNSSEQVRSDVSQIVSDIIINFETSLQTSSSSILMELHHQMILGASLLAVGLLLIIGFLFITVRKLTKRLHKVSTVMRKVANGNEELGTKVEVIANDEIDEVAKAFNRLADSLNSQLQKEQALTWMKSNIADITTSISGKQDLESLAQTLLSKVAPLVDASQAVFYVKEDGGTEVREPFFKLLGSYAFKERKHVANIIHYGEGLIGQAALEKAPIILTNVPADYIQISSGLGEATPFNLYILPISFEGEVKGILEIASFNKFNEIQQTFLEELMNSLGIILESVISRIKLASLLEESQTLMEEIQTQSEELQSQQEVLRATNEELEVQTKALRESEERLQAQQEELEQTNVDLEEKAKSLEEQNKRFERTNREVKRARDELEEKAKQLALSSKYKSEFLANMSHELRTPLNSLLILSKLLADNTEGNLTPKQVEFSQTIYSSGNDLLTLINDILDLAKIESGKMKVNAAKVSILEIADFIESAFRPMANDKGITFSIDLQEGIPQYVYSDEVRIQQVLKNLLSNAFKFTSHGEVKLEIGLKSMGRSSSDLAFSVVDTGIGIPKDKQELIFQAFQQADGTTSRKYGGTGLGLSISREIANHLGGEIILESEEGKGSRFTFFVGNYQKEYEDHLLHVDEVAVTKESTEEQTTHHEEILEMKASADIEENDTDPITRLLIVDDDIVQRNALMELVGDMDVIIKAVSSGYEAIEELKVNKFDCMILDLGLSDTSGFELLEKIKSDDETGQIRVFVYTGRDITSKEEYYLNKYAHTVIIKDEHSPQRLKEELEFYLNEKNKPNSNIKKLMGESVNDTNGLDGKRILLVDDDVRNVYAISNILELYGMKISFAENGIEALETLNGNLNVDLILMDIMMPEMDGYETMRRLRANSKFEGIPIIALTAKAMKEDREKCMAAGASDYIVKPVDPDQLISLIKVWLYQ